MTRPSPSVAQARRERAQRAARALARDIIDWECQFGLPTLEDVDCLVAKEDLARWCRLARRAVGR